MVQAHASQTCSPQAGNRPRDTEKPETQRPAPRVIHRLEDLFSRFEKTELLRIAKVHHIGGCDELGKNKLAPSSGCSPAGFPAHGPFFGTISDETAAEFEKAAAARGMEYQGGPGSAPFSALRRLLRVYQHGTAVVPSDVAEAYDELNTEKFQSERHYRSQVWACCKAAVYLYGAADAGQGRQSARQLAVRQMRGEITRLCREMKGVWTDFAYWDGRLIDWDLVQADAYKDVLNYQKGKGVLYTFCPQVREIARTGAVEIKRHIRPLKAFFLAMVGCDEETAQEAASSIHHHIGLGQRQKQWKTSWSISD